MEQDIDNYECVTKYDVLKGYLEHFRQVSIDNDVPGLLSFFFIMGQASIPYMRIPVGAGNLDPRINVFWIQDTRTGKSVAFQIIQQVMQDAGLECIDFNAGTDAALVGSFVEDENNNTVIREGILAGRKGMNFDEGSILLKTSPHTENTVLFLQSALNAAGSGRNVITKHLAAGTLTIKSEVSLWITTFPPDGIKEYVLDKGIFQRVLLYWRHWTLDMKKNITMELIDSIYNDPKFTIPYDDVVEFFVQLQSRLAKRAQDANSLSPAEWNDASEGQREDWVMAAMRKKKLFNIDGTFKPALKAAADDYYALLEDMETQKQSVCASFIAGINNYTNIFAHHMAMLEGVWTVTGVHVDMAREILYDLYKNLIHWLEDKVKVGASARETKELFKAWKEAYKRCEVYDFEDHRGRNWIRKKTLLDVFGNIRGLSSKATTTSKFNEVSDKFETTKSKNKVFVRMKTDITE